MKIRLCLLCAITLASLSTVKLDAQNQVTASQTVQTAEAGADNPAVATVQKAIAAMGGEAWESVKATTVQSKLVYAKDNRTVTATRSSDWSGAQTKARMDATGESGTVTTTQTGATRSLWRDGKRVFAFPASSDLNEIAKTNPAAALRIAFQRKCQFRPIGKQEVLLDKSLADAVVMECIEPHYRDARARFLWWFDSEGLPTQVQVPIVSANMRYQFSETYRFQGFQSIQGLTVPITVQIYNNDQLTVTETITSVTIAASLPENTFAMSSER